jgi:hypothetical protein
MTSILINCPSLQMGQDERSGTRVSAGLWESASVEVWQAASRSRHSCRFRVRKRLARKPNWRMRTRPGGSTWRALSIMLSTDTLLNDFAVRCFRDIADADYFAARMAFGEWPRLPLLSAVPPTRNRKGYFAQIPGRQSEVHRHQHRPGAHLRRSHRRYKAGRILRRRCRHRPVQYINNILEQDHRAIKRRVNAKQGFREFQAARRTIQGYEAMNMIRKRQARWVGQTNL